MNVLIIIVAVCIILTNSWHVIAAWISRPSHTLFTAIAHYYADYFLYVSQMAQGAHGAWIFASHQFTNEPLYATWIYWPNVMLGHIGSILRMSPFLTYNLAIPICAGVTLYVWLLLIRRIYPGKPLTQTVAFLFVASASNFVNPIRFIRDGSAPLVSDFWFSPAPALNRLGGVPHQMLQTVFILIVILLFTEIISSIKTSPKKISVYRLLILSALAFLAATANPIQMLVATTSLLCVWLIDILKDRSINSGRVIPPTILGISALIGASLTNREFAGQPIFTLAKVWEMNQAFAPNLFTYLGALGPILLFLPFGLLTWFKKIRPLPLAMTLFGVLSVVLFISPVPAILFTSPVRWISPAAYGILPIIAASGVMVFSRIISGNRKQLAASVSVVCIVLYIFFTVPALMTQVASRLTPLTTDPLMALNYIGIPQQHAFTALKMLPGDGVVLTDPQLPYDVVIPALTGKITFTGHPVHTLYPDEKNQLRQSFFSGSMDRPSAAEFLRNHHIGFVLAESNTTSLTGYPFLHVSYNKNGIVIYTVRN